MEEFWSGIEEFPDYEISNFGVVQNIRTGRIMAQTRTRSGHLKVNLYEGSFQATRSVHRLVAECFVERPGPRSGTLAPCDTVIALDGDVGNVMASNLAWRPRSLAWHYARQFSEAVPAAWHLLRVRNIDTRARYESIIDAGIGDGVIWKDIWISTYTNRQIAPFGHRYEVWGTR